MTRMVPVVAAWYQCSKFHLGDKMIKVRSNQCLIHDCNEKSFDEIELSEVKDRKIVDVQTT